MSRWRSFLRTLRISIPWSSCEPCSSGMPWPTSARPTSTSSTSPPAANSRVPSIVRPSSRLAGFRPTWGDVAIERKHQQMHPAAALHQLRTPTALQPAAEKQATTRWRRYGAPPRQARRRRTIPTPAISMESSARPPGPSAGMAVGCTTPPPITVSVNMSGLDGPSLSEAVTEKL